jgi:hypothetical protein
MLARAVLSVGLGLLMLSGSSRARQGGNAPEELAFLEPWFTPSHNERQKLAGRGVVVRALPSNGKQIAVLAACAIALSPEAFVARVQSAWEVEQNGLAAGRFGDPPAASDLARLSLDDGDIDRLRRCRPGDCRLNLSDGEIAALRSSLATRSNGESGDVQQIFRNVIVERARRYLSGGLDAVPDYHDRSDPVPPAKVFAEILAQAPYITGRLPRIATYLERFPATDVRPDASFLHWSRVIMNEKAVVRVSHVSIFRSAGGPALPQVAVVGQQVYASRYMNGELAVTLLFSGASGSANYLVHVDRSELDELGGAFSGLKRSLMEGRITREAAGALAGLRDRLELSAAPHRPKREHHEEAVEQRHRDERRAAPEGRAHVRRQDPRIHVKQM